MAAPRPKKKARPAKDLKPGDVRSQYTFKNESPQQSARDIKASDLRQKYAEGPKQSRPAADLKPGDSRASYLKKAKAKPYQPAPRAPKYAKPIGPQMPASTAKSVSRLATGATTVAKRLPLLDIFNPSFMSYKTGGQAGPGSDKPVQSLKKKYAQPIGPERPKIGSRRVYTSPVGPFKPADSESKIGSRRVYTSPVGPFKPTGGGPKSRQGSSSPSIGVKRSDSYFGDISSYGGTQKTKVAKKDGGSAKKKAKPTSAAPKKAREMTFQEAVRRNRTEEYERAKFRPKKSILSLFKKKGNK